VINLLEVSGIHQVMIEVTIAEMSRSVGRDFSVDFEAMIDKGARAYSFSSAIAGAGATTANPNLFGGYAGNELTLDGAIEALRQRGLVKVLAEPTLVARSGQKASFLAGGEVPVPVPQGLGTVSVEFKPFGVGVEFVPTVLGSDRIHLEVTPEVSAPDFTLGTAIEGVAVPAFNTRRASTSVELRDGQSFAIAGLLSDRVSSVVDEVPGFADVPILGQLFRSQEFRREETELVLIVTPRLVKPLPAGPKRLPTDDYVPPSDSEFFVFGRMEGSRHDASRDPEGASGAEEGGMMGARGHRVAVSRATGDEQ
jgi:pilus assembly protein CpaC